MTDFRLSSISDLSGRIALVTGGGTGIGLMIAKGLAANGAKVYITGRRMEVLQEAASAQNPGAKHPLIPLNMNVTDKISIQEASKAVQEKEGKLHVLVNNAGVGSNYVSFLSDSHAPERASPAALAAAIFAAESFEGWNDTFSTNVTAPLLVTAAFLGLLAEGAKDTETACVINITSSFGFTNLSMNMFAYGVSKAAAEHVTRMLSTELALKGVPVRVNSIAPGIFPSQLTGDAATVDGKAAETQTGAVNPIPARRAGRAHEMVLAAVYLAANGYANGMTMLLDGGSTSVNP